MRCPAFDDTLSPHRPMVRCYTAEQRLRVLPKTRYAYALNRGALTEIYYRTHRQLSVCILWMPGLAAASILELLSMPSTIGEA